MVDDKCTHAESWLLVYHSAVESGYQRGYAEGFAAAQLSNDQFAELVSWKIEDRQDRRTANAEFSRKVIGMVNTAAERRKRGIK